MHPSQQRDLPALVGLTGYMGVGKNHVASIMQREYGYRIYGFADALKELAHLIGWDGTKRPHHEYGNFGRGAYNGRMLLQELGVGARAIIGEDIWVKTLLRRLDADRPTRAVIADVRFQNEADTIRERGGVVIRVGRRGYIGTTHVSEVVLDRIPTDGLIVNDGKSDLRGVVEAVLRRASAP